MREAYTPEIVGQVTDEAAFEQGKYSTAILRKLSELNTVNGFGKKMVDLQQMASLMASDFIKQGEPLDNVIAVIDRWRLTQSTWPTMARLLALCNETRTNPQNQRQQSDAVASLPEAKDGVKTPGMQYFFIKAFKERWTNDEYTDRRAQFRNAYLRMEPQGQWPKTEGEFKALLNSMFGVHPQYERKIFGVEVV